MIGHGPRVVGHDNGDERETAAGTGGGQRVFNDAPEGLAPMGVPDGLKKGGMRVCKRWRILGKKQLRLHSGHIQGNNNTLFAVREVNRFHKL